MRTLEKPLLLLAGLALAAVAACVAAQERWPVRPVRLVHGFTSGGSVDITARLLAARIRRSRDSST